MVLGKTGRVCRRQLSAPTMLGLFFVLYLEYMILNKCSAFIGFYKKYLQEKEDQIKLEQKRIEEKAKIQKMF